MKRIAFALPLLIIVLISGHAQPTAALLAERVEWNLCMNESNGRWTTTVRFYGSVDVVYSDGVPPWIRDLVTKLIPRVNAVISPGATLQNAVATPSQRRIEVLYGQAGFDFLKSKGYIAGSASQYRGYNYFWSRSGAITNGYIWFGTNATRGTVAQELTQVLGACADWPQAPVTALWRDDCRVEWLDDAEEGVLYYLYHRLRGGESRDQVYREVFVMAGG